MVLPSIMCVRLKGACGLGWGPELFLTHSMGVWCISCGPSACGAQPSGEKGAERELGRAISTRNPATLTLIQAEVSTHGRARTASDPKTPGLTCLSPQRAGHCSSLSQLVPLEGHETLGGP